MNVIWTHYLRDAMLAHVLLIVCLSVCLSVCHKQALYQKQLNIGSRKRRHVIDQGL